MIGRSGTQQSTDSLTGILNKLKEPGSFLASSESYILDDDGLTVKPFAADAAHYARVRAFRVHSHTLG
jgi:hypothetical protein